MLVAIAIPIFTAQLEKSREATDIANVRSAYAEVMTNYLTDHDSTATVTVEARQTVEGWQGDSGMIEYFSENKTVSKIYSAQTGSYTVGIAVNSATGEATPNIN